MPIYSLEGTPGSGKTLYCVQKVVPDFLRIRDMEGNLVPRHIYTNIDGFKPYLICAWLGIPYESISEYFHVLGQRVDDKGHVYEDKDYVRWWFLQDDSIEWIETVNANKQRERVPNMEKAKPIPVGSLVIIDELQNYYSNRDFSTKYSKECIDYITKNRHYGWTMWWMSQDIESVDVTFRRNTETVYFLEKREKFGSSNSASVKMYEGWLAGQRTSMPPYATATFHYDSKYFQAYNSYFKGVKGEKRYKVNVFLQHKGFVFVCIVFLLCVIAVIFNNPVKGLKKGMKTASGQTDTQTTATATDPPKHHSFSGASGGAVVKDDRYEDGEQEEPCYTKYFINRGVPYVVLDNGRTAKLDGGKKYHECE